MELKRQIISAVITFTSSFLTVLAIMVANVSIDTLSNPDTWSGGAIVAFMLTAARSALKVVSEKYVLK